MPDERDDLDREAWCSFEEHLRRRRRNSLFIPNVAAVDRIRLMTVFSISIFLR